MDRISKYFLFCAAIIVNTSVLSQVIESDKGNLVDREAEKAFIIDSINLVNKRLSIQNKLLENQLIELNEIVKFQQEQLEKISSDSTVSLNEQDNNEPKIDLKIKDFNLNNSSNGNLDGTQRRLLSRPEVEHIYVDVDCSVCLKIVINSEGRVVNATNNPSKTTTADAIVIHQVIAAVKRSAYFNKTADSQLTQQFITIRLFAK